jgi:hypothetical protein
MMLQRNLQPPSVGSNCIPDTEQLFWLDSHRPSYLTSHICSKISCYGILFINLITKNLELILAPDSLIQFKEIDKCLIKGTPVIKSAPGINLALDAVSG